MPCPVLFDKIIIKVPVGLRVSHSHLPPRETAGPENNCALGKKWFYKQYTQTILCALVNCTAVHICEILKGQSYWRDM